MSLPAPISDPHELFNDRNERGLSLEIAAEPDDRSSMVGTPITRAELSFARGQNSYTMKLNGGINFGDANQIGFGAHWIEARWQV